jgi:hypothetical protein
MQKRMTTNIQNITDKSKIGMTIAQLFGIVIFIFSVGGGFTIVGNTATVAKEMSCENARDIQQMKKDAQKDRELMLELIREVRESQIRIEGKLDLKQDKQFK